MPVNAVVGAVVGAALGAIVWALIAYATGYEVGFVAWAIGGLVGFGAARFGGRGTVSGLTCAALALASIFVGKILTVHFITKKEAGKIAEQIFDRGFYGMALDNAQAFAALESKAAWPQYMVEREFTEATEAGDVTSGEVATFERESVPELRRLAGAPPPYYEDWVQETRAEFVDAVMEETPLVESVTDSLGLIDIIFALLGIGTAFKLGEGLGDGGGERRRPVRPTFPRTGPGPGGSGSPPPLPGSPEPPPDGRGRGDAPVRRRRRL